MSFYDVLALGGVMATILGLFLTLYAIINNRTLKAEARNINELISQFRKEHHETMQIMSGNLDEFRREHRETMQVMSEKLDEFRREHRETMRIMSEKLDEFRREHRETMERWGKEHAEMIRIMSEKLDEFRRSHEETIKYIANLIVTNGERTRQEIRKKTKR
ncbi:hypothetical protein JGI3_01127 [Candidatus Kryptobacter tengchongensis]|nr:hypothetical protein JGI3_01127 [Candidatus Kryptobacter tengchongensis]